jgi:uncharacterized protein with GYD domain
MGAEIKDFFLIMGCYDIVLISKAPNDETVAKVDHFYMVIFNTKIEFSCTVAARRAMSV